MNRLNALALLLMSLPAGSQLVARAGVSLTGDVGRLAGFPALECDLFGGELECCNGRWKCHERDDGASDGPRLLSRDRCQRLGDG